MMVSRPSPAQLRAARAMLGWSLLETARLARVSISVVSRIEGGRGGSVPDSLLSVLRGAFEAQGITFPDDPHGEAVRLSR